MKTMINYETVCSLRSTFTEVYIKLGELEHNAKEVSTKLEDGIEAIISPDDFSPLISCCETILSLLQKLHLPKVSFNVATKCFYFV